MTTNTERARELLTCLCGVPDAKAHAVGCPARYRAAVTQALTDAEKRGMEVERARCINIAKNAKRPVGYIYLMGQIAAPGPTLPPYRYPNTR